MAHDHDYTSPPGTWTAPPGPNASRGQRGAARVAIALLAAAGLWTLRPFLPALGWGVILAVALWPAFQRCARRWPQARKLALPAGFALVILLVFVIPVALVAATAIHDSGEFLRWVAEARAQGLPPPAFLQHLPFAPYIVGWWRSTLSIPGGFAHFAPHPAPGGGSAFATGKRIVASVLDRLLLAAAMLLVLFFLLRDGEYIVGALRIGSRRAFGLAGQNVADQAVLAIRGAVNGLVIVGFAEGLLLGVTYAIAGLDHAALLGLLTGLLSVIPLGSTIAVMIAVAMLAAGGHVAAAVILAAIGIVVVFVADHFIRPVLIGGATRLPFVWVLLGLLGGIESWGLIGLVLGPALMAVLMLMWREWVGAIAGPLNPAPRSDAVADLRGSAQVPRYGAETMVS